MWLDHIVMCVCMRERGERRKSETEKWERYSCRCIFAVTLLKLT